MTGTAEPSGPPRRAVWLRSFFAYRHLIAFVILAVEIGLIYHSVLLGHASLATNANRPSGPLFVGDPVAGGPITLPLQKLAALSWAHLNLPVVDPYQGYGLTLLGNQGAPVFPPEILLHLLLPGNYSLWNVLRLLLLAYGAYLLSSSFGQSLLAGLAVGTAAALAGAAPPNVNVDMLNTLAVLPFVLLSVRYLVDPRARHPIAAGLGLATSIAMLALSGFQELLPLLAVVIVVYSVALIVHFQTFRVAAGRLAAGAVAVVAGAVIGLVGLLPTVSVLSAGSGANGPTDHLEAAPMFWLASLAVPSITHGAMNASAPALGPHPVWLLGTPVLILVIVLALLISFEPSGREHRWLIWPSTGLVLVGVAGYVNAGHILNLFGFFPFDLIAMYRFLPFAWWLPWCLLVGVVISNASLIRWYQALTALALAALFDVWALTRYRDALIAAHLSADVGMLRSSVVETALFVCLFLAGAFVGRRWLRELIMTGTLVASCVLYLPTNFYPTSADVVTSVTSPALPTVGNDSLTMFLNLPNGQLPNQGYPLQLFGPIRPKSYTDILNALIPPTTTSNGLETVNGADPSLYNVELTAATIAALRFLGVDRLVSSTPLTLATGAPIPACAPSSAPAALCRAGRGQFHGVSPVQPSYVYAVGQADPVIDPASRIVSAPSNGDAIGHVVSDIGRKEILNQIPAYVTQTARPQRLARSVTVASRSATTEKVHIALHARTGGLVVLRDSYAPGLKASVNGHHQQALPVDGGLWTAVEVGAGPSLVTLNYLTRDDVAEFAAAGVGLSVLGALWGLLAVRWLLRQRRRRRSLPPDAGAEPASEPNGPDAAVTAPDDDSMAPLTLSGG